MWFKLSISFFLIAIAELLVYFWSIQVSHLDSIYFLLAARYSARITVFIFSLLLIWTAVKGLKSIFLQEQDRQNFILLVAMIAFNHLIHFGFLYTNYQINDLVLMTPKSMGGTFGYLVMILMPIYLWKQKILTSRIYWSTISALLMIDIFIIASYLDRWNKDLPLASPKELYIALLGASLVILVLNVYRIFAERKIKLSPTIDYQLLTID